MARITNCIAPAKEAFLLRDLKLEHSDIDSSNKDPCWSDLAILFNDAINAEVNHNQHLFVDEFRSLTFDCSGLVGTSKMLRKKHDEVQGSVEHGLVGCRRLDKTH